MRRQIACALCAVISIATIAPSTVAASPSCGGSSDSGSSGGSSSGSSGSSGSSSSDSSNDSDDDSSAGSSSNPITPACEQTSKTVGRAECRSFGDGWNRARQPRIRLSMGLTHQSLSLAGMKLEGKSTHGGNSHAYTYDPSLTTPSQAELFGGTLGMHFLLRRAHIGFETTLTGGSADGVAQLSTTGLRMRSTFAMQMEANAVAGYATRMGKWGVLGELQTGMRVTSVQVETRLADCIATAMSSELSAILRPQFTVQRWLSPWLTTDLSVGSDVFQERDLSMTLSLTAHSRSYDGMY